MANPSTTNISIRMDSDLKQKADEFFNELGMNLSTAFNIFVRQSLREGRIPFSISLEQPNAETIAAMQETQDIIDGKIKTKSYSSAKELIEELEAEIEAESKKEGDSC